MLLYFTTIMFHFSLKNNFDDLASLNISLSDFLYSILLGSNSGPKMITPTESNLCLGHMVVGILAISCVNRVSFCQCSRPVAPRRLHCRQKQHNGRGELGGYSFFFLPSWEVLLRCKGKNIIQMVYHNSRGSNPPLYQQYVSSHTFFPSLSLFKVVIQSLHP